MRISHLCHLCNLWFLSPRVTICVSMKHSLSYVLLTGVVVLAGGLCACQERRVVHDTWQQWREMEWSGGGERDPLDPLRRRDGPRYGILLNVFDGPDQTERVKQRIATLKQENVPDLWVQSREGMTYLYRGQFADPDSSDAANAVRQMRMVAIDGERPYEMVQITLLTGSGSEGPAGEHDLRQYSGYMSLQIAAFEAEQKALRKKAAEDYVKTLRAKGDDAYYYHGKHRSMVTVGIFTEDDIYLDGGMTRYGPRIRELQEKHPHNLVNGHTVIETSDGQKRVQPSTLIRVP